MYYTFSHAPEAQAHLDREVAMPMEPVLTRVRTCARRYATGAALLCEAGWLGETTLGGCFCASCPSC